MGSELWPLYHTMQWSAFLLPMWRSPVQISALRPAILAEFAQFFCVHPHECWVQIWISLRWSVNNGWERMLEMSMASFKYICLEILNLLWSWGLNSNYWQDEKVLNLKYQHPTTHVLYTCSVRCTVADSDKKVRETLSSSWCLHLGSSKCKPAVLSSKPWC